jgi:uncharacterized protein
MGLVFILIIVEIFTPVVFWQHFYISSKPIYYISLLLHVILSMWLWLLLFETSTYRSFYDTPQNIWMLMSLRGMLVAVVIPRIILILCHFSGVIARIKTGGHIRKLTNASLIFVTLFFLVIASGTLYGKFNFKTENVTIKIKDLNQNLDGIKIVQLSDIHLAGFHHHRKLLQKVMAEVNSFNPDLVVNTGDFVNYGWREFDRSDTILSKAKGKYGNYAVMGNHDFGTYHPDYTESDRANNVLIMNNKIKASGYKVLNDEFTTVNIGDAKIGLIGIITMGRHPHITHGDLGKTIAGLDSVDLKILLCHDPNQWEEDVSGKTDIDITLSGHTHGMQIGIITKKFRWSPSKYFYPHWNGLYYDKGHYQYVNRGLGELSVPFRIWMPPEITVLTLRKQ